ncbi:MAG: hypothetical protein ACT4PV_13820 [Planctomycetaceae bacterium]
MRLLSSLILTLALVLLGGTVRAGDPAPPGEGGAPPDPAAAGGEEPKPPPLFTMPEAERRKIEKFLSDYFHPGRQSRTEIIEKLERHIARGVQGHTVLEDVATLTDIANRLRTSNPKYGRGKGRITEVDVKPAEHGFPGGIGTVRYHVYIPKEYEASGLAPLIFCLPDNREWANPQDYLKAMWIDRSPGIAQKYVIVVPEPQSRGEAWTTTRSWARAMISLRHVCGTYGADAKSGGAAVDMRRIFIDGGEAAALAAARFREVFVGAILHACQGRTQDGPDLARLGGIAGLPAYVVCDPKKAAQLQFGESLRAQNAASSVEQAAAADATYLGDPAKIAPWMEALERVDQPAQIDFLVHDPSFQRCFWINVVDFDAAAKPAPGIVATADRVKNEVLLRPNGVDRFELWLNDAIVDLSRDVRIAVQDGEQTLVVFEGKVDRRVADMLGEWEASNHPWRVYTSRFLVDLPSLRAAQAKLEAEKAAKAEEGAKN